MKLTNITETPFSRMRLLGLMTDGHLRELSPQEIIELQAAENHFPKSAPWIERAAFWVATILSIEE